MQIIFLSTHFKFYLLLKNPSNYNFLSPSPSFKFFPPPPIQILSTLPRLRFIFLSSCSFHIFTMLIFLSLNIFILSKLEFPWISWNQVDKCLNNSLTPSPTPFSISWNQVDTCLNTPLTPSPTPFSNSLKSKENKWYDIKSLPDNYVLKTDPFTGMIRYSRYSRYSRYYHEPSTSCTKLVQTVV